MLLYSLEAPHRGTSDEYPQHMFSWRNKKKYLPDNLSYLDLCHSPNTKGFVVGTHKKHLNEYPKSFFCGEIRKIFTSV